MHGRLAAEVEALQVETLVGRVRKAIRQDEADQQTGRLEQAAHHIDGADRTAGTDQGWLRAIHLPQSPLPGPDQRMVDRRDPWIALAAELGDGDPDRLWRNLLDVAAQRLADVLRDVAGWIFKVDQYLGQRLGGVGRYAAEVAGV